MYEASPVTTAAAAQVALPDFLSDNEAFQEAAVLCTGTWEANAHHEREHAVRIHSEPG